MSLSVFLPVRKGSERVLNKNTRKFADYEGGLLQLKLEQLIKVEEADEIVISTNDERSKEIAASYKKWTEKIKIIERPAELGHSETILSDLIKYAGEICSSEDILWTHVTSPCFNIEMYSEAIQRYRQVLKSDYDSLVTGRKYNDFLLKVESKEIINNHSGLEWPRTQDLDDCFELNNAVFLASAEMFRKGKRMGSKPFLLQTGKMASLDIDDEEDFKIAEAVYERIYR